MWKNVRLSADVRIFAAHLLLGTILTIFVVMNANGLPRQREYINSTEKELLQIFRKQQQ